MSLFDNIPNYRPMSQQEECTMVVFWRSINGFDRTLDDRAYI